MDREQISGFSTFQTGTLTLCHKGAISVYRYQNCYVDEDCTKHNSHTSDHILPLSQEKVSMQPLILLERNVTTSLLNHSVPAQKEYAFDVYVYERKNIQDNLRRFVRKQCRRDKEFSKARYSKLNILYIYQFCSIYPSCFLLIQIIKEKDYVVDYSTQYATITVTKGSKYVIYYPKQKPSIRNQSHVFSPQIMQNAHVITSLEYREFPELFTPNTDQYCQVLVGCIICIIGHYQ